MEKEKDFFKDVKPTPLYKLHPKSKTTIRVIYTMLFAILIWSVWSKWDFWKGLFQ